MAQLAVNSISDCTNLRVNEEIKQQKQTVFSADLLLVALAIDAA